MSPIASSEPTPAPGTRSDRRKARTAAAILGAAERLFLDRGFGATTIEDLSAAADVAIGSIYAHFGSKEGVYAALVERALELDERYVGEGDAALGAAPLARLVGRAEGYLRFAREHPAYFRIFRFPPPDRPTELGAATARLSERVRVETERMAALIEAAVAEGALRPVDAEAAARYLWAAWDGVIASHLGPANMDLDDEAFERLLAFAREALIRGVLGEAGTRFLLDGDSQTDGPPRQ